MKKTYETPTVEKLTFQYRDQVVAASVPMGNQWDYDTDGTCETIKNN